jgi:hypothetical protein
MHIPKASGSSLILSLSEAISPAQTVGGFDHVLFGDFNSFHTFSACERERIADDPFALPAHADFVAGHFAYSTLRQAYPQGQLVTVLREPSTRVMSLWMYWRKAMAGDLSGLGLWADYVRHAGKPLRAFLAEPRIAAQTDNMAVRQLLWPHPSISGSGFVSPHDDKHLLRLARQRLADFAFTGIVENPGLQAALATFLGRPVALSVVNDTDKICDDLRSPFAQELDSTTLDLLDARSRLDLVLWRDIAKLPALALARLRQQTILQHVARYSAIMAG